MTVKPINQVTFWRRRLNQAHAEGRPVSAAIYDASVDTWERIQRETKVILAQHLKSGCRILDAGCGFGALYEILPPGIDYRGVDLSPDFIEIARFKYPEGHFEVGDLNDLSVFADRSFDWAVIRSMEGMVNENLGSTAWDKMFLELRRVCKKCLFISYDDPVVVKVVE